MPFNLSLRLCLLFCLVTYYCNAQTVDTVWLNSKWEKTTKAESVYHRTIQKSADLDLYMVGDYYNTGEVQMTGTYLSLQPEVKEGLFTWYYKSGKKRAETFFKDRNAVKQIQWDENGKITLQRELIDVIVNEDGKKTRTKAYLDVAPQFEGGPTAVEKFIQDNFKYPQELTGEQLHGRMIVDFSVDTNGKVTDVSIEQGVNPLLDVEAIRVIKSMPAWKPAVLDGKPVKVGISVPISI